jgi:hypothetical protein
MRKEYNGPKAKIIWSSSDRATPTKAPQGMVTKRRTTAIPRPKLKRIPKWVAIHEAGHAVVMVAACKVQPSFDYPWSIKEVSIGIKGNTIGRMRSDAPFRFENPASVDWLLLSLYAGEQAERIIMRRTSGTNNWDDLIQAEKLIEERADWLADHNRFVPIEVRRAWEWPDPEEECERYIQLAAAFVRNERKAIVALAEVLQSKRMMRGKEVEALVLPLLARDYESHSPFRRPSRNWALDAPFGASATSATPS